MFNVNKLIYLAEFIWTMGCCTTRMKVDEHTSVSDYHAVNTLPTYENVFQVYNELQLPQVNFI